VNQAVHDAAAGRSDLAVDAIGPDRWNSASFAAMQARLGDRLRVSPTQDWYGMFMNTRIAPFDNPRVRRALAYAIDRNAVKEDWFLLGNVTCQYIQPVSPGYRPYCPYTTSPAGNQWQGANLAKAQALVKGLDPEGTKVTVWSWPIAAPGMQHVVDALKELRFDARLKVWPNGNYKYFSYLGNSRNHVQAGFWGWIGGGANTGSGLEQFRCAAFAPASPVNYNPAEFCDHGFDRLWNRADRIQATSLAVANEEWAKADRLLVDAAPWIPLISAQRVDVLSGSVHGYKRGDVLGVLYDQMWVR
jgi:peptide/nickel transport system substrate-binding protein